MDVFKIPDLIRRDMLPGVKAGFVHTQNMTVAYWHFEPGAQIPLHAHPHEQVTNIIEGRFALTVDGKETIMTAGSSAAINPGLSHSGHALTKTYIIDVFYPAREDYRGL